MATEDVLRDAIDALYSIEPDEFMPRRVELAAKARKTDKAAAKDIAALRKPTRSAYVLNQLVRSDPGVADQLAELGGHLLAAQESLDGAKMRELSMLRRGLVEELADQAFSVTGQPAAPAAVRDEVVATLNAAVADEGVRAQLRTGTLLRSTRWDGFGFASAPELSVVRPTPARQPQRPGTASTTRAGGSSAAPASAEKARKATTSGTSAARADREAIARTETKAAAKAEEQRRGSALADAQRSLREADAALATVTKAEADQQTRVRHLHEQLTDARRRLDEIRIDVRRAENRQRKAQQARDRHAT